MSRPSWAQVCAVTDLLELRRFADATHDLQLSAAALWPAPDPDVTLPLAELLATIDALVELVPRDEGWAGVARAFLEVGDAMIWDQLDAICKGGQR